MENKWEHYAQFYKPQQSGTFSPQLGQSTQPQQSPMGQAGPGSPATQQKPLARRSGPDDKKEYISRQAAQYEIERLAKTGSPPAPQLHGKRSLHSAAYMADDPMYMQSHIEQAVGDRRSDAERQTGSRSSPYSVRHQRVSSLSSVDGNPGHAGSVASSSDARPRVSSLSSVPEHSRSPAPTPQTHAPPNTARKTYQAHVSSSSSLATHSRNPSIEVSPIVRRRAPMAEPYESGFYTFHSRDASAETTVPDRNAESHRNDRSGENITEPHVPAYLHGIVVDGSNTDLVPALVKELNRVSNVVVNLESQVASQSSQSRKFESRVASKFSNLDSRVSRKFSNLDSQVANQASNFDSYVASQSRIMNTMNSSNQVVYGRVNVMEQRTSRLELVNEASTPDTLAPSTVGLVPVWSGEVENRIIGYKNGPGALPSINSKTNQFIRQPAEGRGVRPPQQPEPFLPPHPMIVATSHDDVFGNSQHPMMHFRIETLQVHLHSVGHLLEQLVYKWTRNQDWPLDETSEKARHIIELGTKHLDSRRTSLYMLKDKGLRTGLITGFVVRFITESVYNSPLFSEIYQNDETPYHDAWAKERQIKDFLDANDYAKRNGLAHNRARFAETITTFPDFWRAANVYASKLMQLITTTLRPVLPHKASKALEEEFHAAIFDSIKVSVLMQTSPNFYETTFIRYGESWNDETMEQRNPELAGLPCNERPSIWVVRCTIHPQYTQKNFAPPVPDIRVLQKYEVLLCDRKGNLRGKN